MRQLIKISLFFIYLVCNAGMSYSLHFCSEKLEAINFYTEQKKCCSATEEESDCCEDVFSLDQANTEQTIAYLSDIQFLRTDSTVALMEFSALLSTLISSDSNDYKLCDKELSFIPDLPIFIKHQTFLI
ncbi:HYC_CC_PP family protein [Anditalea andensis]|uniref:Uncharacterized protein n=1 Tax=Anditalea andensis TaxID=1048983 RepID=A0A074KR81_9BACT|nr:hypothetical protein [Anditalea andensis]KEO72461.1 hypothetical protein EL17_17125 [Anditalea andensis]